MLRKAYSRKPQRSFARLIASPCMSTIIDNHEYIFLVVIQKFEYPTFQGGIWLPARNLIALNIITIFALHHTSQTLDFLHNPEIIVFPAEE
jgi:hypothetical protein